MKFKSLFYSVTGAAVLIASTQPADAVLAAFVNVAKNDAADTRFHLAEIEAFSNGVVPDDLGGATFDNLATSTNDIPSIGVLGVGDFATTTALEHGGGNQDPNNVLENAGAVWSTANGLATNAQYTLDLGGTHDVTTVRMWPRADGCCSNRWENLEIQLLDSSMNPIGGTKQFHTADVGNVSIEVSYAAVPEPSSLALLGLAGASVLFRRRRR